MHDRSQGARGRLGPHRPLLMAALLSLAILPTHAQTTTPPSGPTASRQAQPQATTRDARVRQLIGKEVRNPQGEKLGEINDLIIDVNNEVIHYAVLSFGGLMGLGDKLFAYPLTVFRHSLERDELVLDVDKDRLRNAPGFERNRWPDWSTPEYGAAVERHFGQTARITPRPNPHLLRASELLGKDVDDNNARNAGEIEDIVVSMSSGRVRYVVLDFDRSWNMKDRLLPLPLKSLRFPADRRADLVLLQPREQLDIKQGFEKRQWPDVNDPNYRRQIDGMLERMGVAAR